MDRQQPIQDKPHPPIPVSQQSAPAPSLDQQYVFMGQPMIVYPQITYNASGQPQLVYMMPQQPFQQPLQHQIIQSIQQPLQQSFQQPLQQPFHQFFQQPLQQSLQQPFQQSIQQPLQQPLQLPLQQPLLQPFQQPLQQQHQQPIQQPLQQPLQQTLQQPLQQPLQQTLQQPLQQPLQQQLIYSNQRIVAQPQHTQQMNPQPTQQLYSPHTNLQTSSQPQLLMQPHQQYNLQPVVSSQLSTTNAPFYSGNNTRPFIVLEQRANDKIPIASLRNPTPQIRPRLQPAKRKYDSSPRKNVSDNAPQSDLSSMSTLGQDDKHVPKTTISDSAVKAFVDNTIASGKMPWKRKSSSVPNSTKQTVPLCPNMSVVNIKDGSNYEIRNKIEKTEPKIKGVDGSASVCENIPNVSVQPSVFNQERNDMKTPTVNETLMNENTRRSFQKQEQKSTISDKTTNISQNDINIVQNTNKSAFTTNIELSIENEKLSKNILCANSNTITTKVVNIGNEPKQSPNKVDDILYITESKMWNRLSKQNMPDQKSTITELTLIPKDKSNTLHNKKCDISGSEMSFDMPSLDFINSEDISSVDYNKDNNLTIESPRKAKLHSEQQSDKLLKSSNITNENESVAAHNLEITQRNNANESDIKTCILENDKITKSTNKSLLSKDNEVTSSSSPSKTYTNKNSSGISEASGETVDITHNEKIISKSVHFEELSAGTSKSTLNSRQISENYNNCLSMEQSKPNLHNTLDYQASVSLCDEEYNKTKSTSKKSKGKTRKSLKQVTKSKNVKQIDKLISSSQMTNNKRTKSKNKNSSTKSKETENVSPKKVDTPSILRLALDKFTPQLKANVDNLESAIWNEIMLIVDKNTKIGPEHIAELKEALSNYLNSRNSNLGDKTRESQEHITKDKIEPKDSNEVLKERLSKIVNAYKEIVSSENFITRKPVLTHVVDGHVIQESNDPFPVMKYNQETTSPESRVTRSKVNPFSGISQMTIHSWKIWDLALHLVKHGWYNTAVTLMDHEMDGPCLSFCSKEQLLEIGLEKERVDIIMSSIERTCDTPFIELENR